MRKAKRTLPKSQEKVEEVVNGNGQKFPEVSALVAQLKACARQKNLCKGCTIHADILKWGFLGMSIYVSNNLVNMYVKCGALAKAQEVFDELPVRDVVTWTVLIAGYAEYGRGEEALNCFDLMQHEGLSPNAVTFLGILKACGSIGAADKGQKLHTKIVKEGFLENNVLVGTALVDMYAKCGVLEKAAQVLDELPVRNVVSWNALIAGYVEHGHAEEALSCFERMQLKGFAPNIVTFLSILKACGSIGAVKGKEVHAKLVKERLLEKSHLVGNALVGMYAKCGALAKAQDVFDELPFWNVVSWNALIAGYARYGHGEEALNCLERMQRQGLSPNKVTFLSILKACGSLGAIEKGKKIHVEIARERLLEQDIMVGTAVVDMYAKCGALAVAQEVFDELPVQNVVTWNVLIAGYVQHGHGEEALNCYDRMQDEGLSPNATTFLCSLKACGSIGAVDKAKEIHTMIVKEGLLEKNISVGTALVDTYVKCGALAKAQELFDELPVQNVVSWSAIITGYAQFGKVDSVFDIFNKMIGEGVEPNLITLTVVLNACSHSGLVDEGQLYFETMSTHFGIFPTIEHYTCMVDLFGRAGYFDKAIAVIKKMPFCKCRPIWLALLGACRKWGNVKLGRLAFDHAVQLDNKDAAAYLCMTNIYAASGMQGDADHIESMRVKSEAWKTEAGILLVD